MHKESKPNKIQTRKEDRALFYEVVQNVCDFENLTLLIFIVIKKITSLQGADCGHSSHQPFFFAWNSAKRKKSLRSSSPSRRYFNILTNEKVNQNGTLLS